MKWLGMLFGMLAILGAVGAEKKQSMKQIRIYSQYSFPVEIAQTYWTTDMDFSYALASTIVQWDAQKQIVGGLAKNWSKRNETTYAFSLRPNLKWSDGKPMTSAQIKMSFERAFRAYPDDLRALINMVKEIRAPSPTVLEIVTVSKAAAANLLGKLTEPQFGIVYVDSSGKMNLSKASGPFFASKLSSEEVELKRNPNWFSTHADLADTITVRKPASGFDHQRALLTDSWPNLAQTFSLMPEELLKTYRDRGFSIWRRPLDKVYLFAASKRLAREKETALLQFLDRRLDRSKLGAGLSGYKFAEQTFPYGYELYDSKYTPKKDVVELPEVFRKRAVIVLCPGGKTSSPHIQNIKNALTVVLGKEPDFQCVPLDEANVRRSKGDYDLYMGTFGLADPHPEGLMSYYFEGETSVVPAGAEDFIARLDEARKEQDEGLKLQILKGILRDAKDKGYMLPLFHLSSIGFATGDLDLSHVPETDESLTYSKIRFKVK